MAISSGITFGITAAVCWGAADFAARSASRRAGAFRALFFMQVVGFVALSIYLKSTGGFSRRVAPGWQPWAAAIFAGVLNMAGSIALYHSFEVGVMTIVAPISSSYPALTVALALLSGERIRALSGAGLAVTIVGVVLAATSFAPANKVDGLATGDGVSTAHLSKGVGWSILSAIVFGVMFWFLGFHVLPVVDSAVSVWVIRATTISLLALVAAPANQSLRVPNASMWWLIAIVGLADTTAYVANNSGLHAGPVSVVSVLASLYGAVTVLLSRIFLREHLERSQWLGIALIFAGIILVSL